MRYVVTKRDIRETESGAIVRIYKEKRLDILDVMFIAVISLALCAVLFFTGVYVGAKEAIKQIPEVKPVEQTAPEQVEIVTDSFYSPDVPLSYEEQEMLYNAAEEFSVDYYTMLGLIDTETDFRNVYGDGGKAAGYCQIWRKWWGGLMRDIGAEDLNTPQDNFRTGCAIVAQLTDKYGSTAGALTAYNKGSYSGVISSYARSVMQDAEKWRGK